MADPYNLHNLRNLLGDGWEDVVEEAIETIDDLRTRLDRVTAERDELLAWAEDMQCEMCADAFDGFDPEVCSPDHSGRCWPCEAKVRALAGEKGGA